MKSFKPITFRAAHGYDTKAASDEAELPAEVYGPTQCIQSAAADADINTLMARMGQGAKFPDIPRTPKYEDFTDVIDFHTATEAVRHATEIFMEYPAQIRARFKNNPQLFLEFCNDDNNLDEMRRIGLIPKDETPAPTTRPAGTPPGQPGATAPPETPKAPPANPPPGGTEGTT